MKKVCIFMMLLMAVVIGCSKSDTVVDKATDTYVTVGLKATGEIHITSSALSKASATSSRDLYGVSVYKMVDGRKYNYACGVFDDISLASVKLHTSDVYTITAALVPKGKDIVAIIAGTEENAAWELPFTHTKEDKRLPLNELIYDTTGDLNLEIGRVVPNGKSKADGYNMSNISFYFAKLENYQPTETSVSVNLNMLRYNFGTEFRFKSDEYSKYSRIRIAFNPDRTWGNYEVHYVDVNPDAEYSTITISPILVGSVSETGSMKIAVGTDENNTEFFYGDLEFERNKMYHITVTPPDDSVNNGLNITKDVSDMTDVDKTI